MPRTSVWIVSAVFALAFFFSLATAQTATPPVHRKLPKKPLAMPLQPLGPLSPVPMDQIPAAPPVVSYQQGMLTVVAENSTLADILSEVRKLTGASIEIPSSATERVVTRVGPGPVRDVLASLLNGTSFNYVMVGSHSDPAALSALVLTAKSAGGPIGGGNASPSASAPVAVLNQPPPPVASEAPPPGSSAVAEADDSDNSDSDEDTPVAGNAAGQAMGGLGADPTTDQLQQMKEKLGPPPNIQPPPLAPPTIPPHQ